MEQISVKNNEPNLNIKYYDYIAKNLLLNMCGRQAQYIINDPNKFGTVVSELMIADWKWSGVGTIFGYRKQRVKWILGRLNEKNPEEISLYTEVGDQEYIIDKLVDRKTECKTSKIDDSEIIEKIREYLQTPKLTKNEKICIEKYYLSEYPNTYESIANEIGMTRQGVKVNITNALEKIKASIVNPIDHPIGV